MRSFFCQTSINSLQDPLYQSNTSFFKQMSKKLEQASRNLTFSQFNNIFKQVIRKCIKKAEVDQSFTDAIPNIKRWMNLYSYDLQIMARLLILESSVMRKQWPSESIQKINKVKHLLIDTDYQYLLPKVFVVQSRLYQITNEKQMKLKSLKKCIQFGQNYALEYLKQSNQIRLQIADNMIIAYFQVYKLTKQTKPNAAIDYLAKAYQAALKNYGNQHFSSLTLSQVLYHQKNLLSNMERYLPKALSNIQTVNLKKSVQLSILYSWQQQLLVVQIYKVKGDEQKDISQSTLHVKLNMERIKMLKTRHFSDWIQLYGTQIKINQEVLKKILQFQIQQKPIINDNPSTTRQFGRDQLFKKNADVQSDSSDETQIVIPEGQKFLRFYRDRSNISRSKSRDNQSSRH